MTRIQTEKGRARPVCQGTSLHRSEILHPVPTLVAGVPIDLGDTKFSFVRCADCNFHFKDPVIPEEDLNAGYAKADKEHWTGANDPIRRRFDTMKAMIARTAPSAKSVLDVGCFNGALLQYLGKPYSLFGIEPSTDASETASGLGITMLGSTLADLPPGKTFDVITAIDVVEHVLDPVAFWRACSSALNPGGVFIIFTGDTDARSWRMQRGMDWYCSLPEHVSFYNHACLTRLCKMSGLRVHEHQRLPHDRNPLARTLKESARALDYSAARATGGLGIPPIKRKVLSRRAPKWMTARNHFLCAMVKP